MYQSSQPQGNTADNEGQDKSRGNGLTEVNLLDDHQWRYVQRWYGLSPRELEVARLICCGYHNDDVAGNLRIRCGTVKTHLRNIYRRIHVTNKIQMLLKFVEQATANCRLSQDCPHVHPKDSSPHTSATPSLQQGGPQS